MTNTEIKNIINEVNTNKEIKWSIAKNTKTEITLTNSYDKSISYSVHARHDEDEEWVAVLNNHMITTAAYIMVGDTRWDDCKTVAEGMILGIKAAVNHFNKTY